MVYKYIKAPFMSVWQFFKQIIEPSACKVVSSISKKKRGEKVKIPLSYHYQFFGVRWLLLTSLEVPHAVQIWILPGMVKIQY